jgi:hypothetical protein
MLAEEKDTETIVIAQRNYQGHLIKKSSFSNCGHTSHTLRDHHGDKMLREGKVNTHQHSHIAPAQMKTQIRIPETTTALEMTIAAMVMQTRITKSNTAHELSIAVMVTQIRTRITKSRTALEMSIAIMVQQTRIPQLKAKETSKNLKIIMAHETSTTIPLGCNRIMATVQVRHQGRTINQRSLGFSFMPQEFLQLTRITVCGTCH